MGKKLDLSKLTDEEAKHVWDVVQRDFDLRKKEEERLRELKGVIEKEDAKRELLSSQSRLNETHCIHCLHPFKFLVNSKRQCLDCHLYTCKSCSRYNKKEKGWVCDPCRLARIAKTGSLEWYYEHVRSRFKRFGSDKVMRSLSGRMPYGQKDPALLEMDKSLDLPDRVYSLPDMNSDYQLGVAKSDSDKDEANDTIDDAEAQRYVRMRKTKRLLSVHPLDLDMDSDYSAQSRRQSAQLSANEGLQTFAEFTGDEDDESEKESMVAEADLASAFHHILQEQGQLTTPPEQEFNTKVHLTMNSHSKKLERSRMAGGSWKEPHRSQHSVELDSSDEDTKRARKLLANQPHTKRRGRTSSSENTTRPGTKSPESHPDIGMEEKELKRKLEKLINDLSDKEDSSEEDEEDKKKRESKPEIRPPRDGLPTNAKKVYFLTGKPETKLRSSKEYSNHSTTTDSELSELEGKVASAGADVQQTESEVSDIETRIAALSAAGLTVKPVEKSRKKSSTQAHAVDTPRKAYNFSDDQSSDSPVTASPEDFKVMSMPHVLRRKFTSSLEMPKNDDSFTRNSHYRGSLTQRNPNGKNRKADRLFAKPVMAHRP